jgi:hypothetical protein
MQRSSGRFQQRSDRDLLVQMLEELPCPKTDYVTLQCRRTQATRVRDHDHVGLDFGPCPIRTFLQATIKRLSSSIASSISGVYYVARTIHRMLERPLYVDLHS